MSVQVCQLIPNRWSRRALALAFFCNTLALAQPQQEVKIQFLPLIKGELFECGKSYTGVGRTSVVMTPTDWRMFISGVYLRDNQGQWVPLQMIPDSIWQDANVALLDFENGKGPCRNGTAGTNTTVRGLVPSQIYTGIKWRIGVPFTLNHKDPTAANPPLSNSAMFWTWQGGYKFIKFDATTSPPSDGSATLQSAFSFHLGSTLCSSTSATSAPQQECQRPNTVLVQLLGQDPRTTAITLDIGNLLHGNDLSTNAPQTPPGCMSTITDPDCEPVFRHLNLPASTNTVQTLDFIRWRQ